jgi:hypothetical protein
MFSSVQGFSARYVPFFGTYRAENPAKRGAKRHQKASVIALKRLEVNVGY